MALGEPGEERPAGRPGLGWRYRLGSEGRFDDRADYFRIDNTHLEPEQVATTAITHFDLPLQPGQDEPLGR